MPVKPGPPGAPPLPSPPAAERPPHPATSIQQRIALPPHPAKRADARPPHPATVMQQRRAPVLAPRLPPHPAVTRPAPGTVQRAQGPEVPDLRWKSDELVGLEVGRREAFIRGSHMTHAVLRVTKLDKTMTVYGLKGDWGGGMMDEDANELKAKYTWEPYAISLNGFQMNLFWKVAQELATTMKYDLVRWNCYSPVTKALKVIRDQTAKDDKQAADIDKMLKGLGGDNFGLGQYK